MKASAVLLSLVMIVITAPSVAADSDDHAAHEPNHVALIVGIAEEDRPFAGGDHRGILVGMEYVRRFKPHWGFGTAFEWVTFDNNESREGILAFPLSYFPKDGWRLLAAPGIEFHNRGEPEEPMLRLGAAYEFVFPNHATLAPEFQIDFLPGGERVYILALSLGYGF